MTRRLIVVSREIIEEAPNSLNRVQEYWHEDPTQCGTFYWPPWRRQSILTTKLGRFQTEYFGTQKTKITLHGVPLVIIEYHLCVCVGGVFFAQYGQVGEGLRVKCKTGIASGEVWLHATLTRKCFMEVPNILTCRGHILIRVEGRRPHCWSCSTAEHVSKASSNKNPVSPPQKPATSQEPVKVKESVGTDNSEHAPITLVNGRC